MSRFIQVEFMLSRKITWCGDAILPTEEEANQFMQQINQLQIKETIPSISSDSKKNVIKIPRKIVDIDDEIGEIKKKRKKIIYEEDYDINSLITKENNADNVQLQPKKRRKKIVDEVNNMEEEDILDDQMENIDSDNEDQLRKLEDELEEELREAQDEEDEQNDNFEDNDNLEAQEGNDDIADYQQFEDEDLMVDENEYVKKSSVQGRSQNTGGGNGIAGNRLGEDMTGDISQYSDDQLNKKLTKRQQNIMKNNKLGKGQLTFDMVELPEKPKKKRANFISEEDQIKKIEREEKRRALMHKQIEDLKRQTVDKILNEAGRKQKQRKEKEEKEQNEKTKHKYRKIPVNEPSIKYISNKYQQNCLFIRDIPGYQPIQIIQQQAQHQPIQQFQQQQISTCNCPIQQENQEIQNSKMQNNAKLCSKEGCQNKYKYKIPQSDLVACSLECYKILKK